MTRRVVEKLCAKKICVDFLAPISFKLHTQKYPKMSWICFNSYVVTVVAGLGELQNRVTVNHTRQLLTNDFPMGEENPSRDVIEGREILFQIF